MSEPKDKQMDEKPDHARMIFGAFVLLVFVWFGLFFILPAVTGKPGIAQNIQSDLQANPENK